MHAEHTATGAGYQPKSEIPAADIARLMGPVARALLGEPNASISTKDRLRFGSRGSLAVNLTDGTYYDHENQVGGGVLQLVERETGQSNGGAVAWIRENLGVNIGSQAEHQPRRLIASYDYTAADGALLFQVCRYHPRDFRQRRPDGRGGWIWNLKEVEPVPYRLPGLAEAELVFVAEGEKDCDNLAAIGLVATTNPGGAGKWRPGYARHLAGKRVIVLPDNDKVGREHAQAIASSLTGIAASVTILELPDLPAKGDVSDWLAAGGTAEKLMTLAAEAATSPRQEDEQKPADPIDQIVADLAGLDPLEYDRRRKAEANRAGIRVSVLDRAVEDARGAEPDTGQGRALDWPEPDPWPEPVVGAELLDDIAATFRRYVVLPPASDTALALWVLHAHAFQASSITPRMAIKSPEKRCGKTTTLEVIQALVPRPILASNITAAAVFRTVEAARPTLLIDEADTFLAEAEELRGILNSGHRRSGEVIRTSGEDHEPRRFSTWAPVAIAAIGQIPGTLEDRSISVELRRRGAGEQVERWRLDRAHLLEPLVRRCARWAADHLTDLGDADPVVPGQLHDRAADNWRPLLAIADAVGGEWPARATAAAVALSAGGAGEGRREMLLRDIRTIFADLGHPDWIASAEIIKKLVDMAERPWPEASRGKPLTPQGLRSLLEPFKIYSCQKQQDGDRSRGYAASSFTDAWTRYLPADASVHPCAGQQTSGFQANRDPCTTESGARMQKSLESSNRAASARMHGCEPPKAEAGGEDWV